MNEQKVRENKLRRGLVRQFLLLKKSRYKDPHRPGYQGYQIADRNGALVAGHRPCPFSFSLEDAEEFAASGQGSKFRKKKITK